MTHSQLCTHCRQPLAEGALFCPSCGTPRPTEIAADPLLGAVVAERYLVHERIGHGKSGVIYRAEHVTLRRKVAVKVLHPELSGDDLAIERFRREATLVGEIDNDHIVEIHDFGKTPDGRLYLAMEYLEGEALDATLAHQGRLPVERSVDILIQAGEALAEAHALGYIHRDLRPRNVYLSRRRNHPNFVKLLDFGLAKLVESEGGAAQTSLGMTFGDPRYMAPEQARGDRVDRRGDIYALGCIAYEMLTGAPPFTGTKTFEILARQVSDAPTPLRALRAEVPEWLEVAVLRMLAKSPNDRFATTTRMVEALRQGLEHGSVMDPDLARRRESVPPPSVSRQMSRLGISELPVDDDSATMAMPKVRRTGTPVVGVPVQVEHEVAAPAPQETHVLPAPPLPSGYSTTAPALRGMVGGTPGAMAGGIAPRGPVETLPLGSMQSEPIPKLVNDGPTEPSSGPPQGKSRGATRPVGNAKPVESAGISQVWFADGERLEGGVDLNQSQAHRLDRARLNLGASSAGLEEYDEPSDRSWPKFALAGGALVVLGLVTWGLWPEDDPEDKRNSSIAQVAMDAGRLASADLDAATVMPTEPAAAVALEAGGAMAIVPDAALGGPMAFDAGITPVAKPIEPSLPPAGTEPEPSLTKPKPAAAKPEPSLTKPKPAAPKPRPGLHDSGLVDPYGDAGDSGGDAAKAEFFARLGEQSLRGGDYAGAAANFQHALDLDPQSVDAVAGLGEIALQQGLYDDAVAHLRKATRLAPRRARGQVLLGEALLGRGDARQAADAFKKALQLDPDNDRARTGFNEASSQLPPPVDD